MKLYLIDIYIYLLFYINNMHLALQHLVHVKYNDHKKLIIVDIFSSNVNYCLKISEYCLF